MIATKVGPTVGKALSTSENGYVLTLINIGWYDPSEVTLVQLNAVVAKMTRQLNDLGSVVITGERGDPKTFEAESDELSVDDLEDSDLEAEKDGEDGEDGDLEEEDDASSQEIETAG